MATRLKTIEYAFAPIKTLADNTLTNFNQITIYIPETIVAFKSVILRITMDDLATTAANYTTRRVDLRLGSNSYETQSNTNAIANSGENMSIVIAKDYTSYFTNNWSGTSMTCDVAVLIAQTTTGQSNLCGRLYITYAYNDTSSTHIKTVYIPLKAPNTALGTSRPSSPIDTIPALDTYLPENSKTYRDIFLWFGANTHCTSTTDTKISHQIDSDTAEETGLYEGAQTSARWSEYIYKPSFTTNTTHEYRCWVSTGAVTRHNCPQIYLVVTYEFNASNTTSVMNSILLPMNWESPTGGTTSADYQRAVTEFYIQESNPSLKRLALLVNYNTPVNLSNYMYFRIGSGTWVQYTVQANAVCGQCGLMIRNDSAYSLTRGKNILTASGYSSNTVNRPYLVTSLWIINYTSDKHTDGVGAHNHTVLTCLRANGASAALLLSTTPYVKFIDIPEEKYYINNAGVVFEYIQNSSNIIEGVIIQAERLSSENGLEWENIYCDTITTDPEVGFFTIYAQTNLFNRFPDDADSDRMKITTARRFITALPNSGLSSTSAFHELLLSIVTYHTITYTVSGDITGSEGGTVTISLHKTDIGKKLLQQTRVGNGSFSFTWYDNTEPLHVEAYEGTTLSGRSLSGVV